MHSLNRYTAYRANEEDFITDKQMRTFWLFHLSNKTVEKNYF